MGKVKSNKEFNWKKFLSTVVIIFIAFIFTVSIFISYGGRDGKVVEMESIAYVNGKPVEFYANSPVVREYQRLREMYKTRTKEEILRKAVQNVVSGMLLEDFSKKNGFDLSEEFIDKITADNVFSLTRKSDVSSSDLKLAKLNVESFLRSSYLPAKVDSFISRIIKRSQSGFFLFKSLDDIKISLDIVEFDEIEFIRLNEVLNNVKSIEDFYLTNYKSIVLDAKIPIVVEKYVFSDRKLAYSFVSNLQSVFESNVTVSLDPEKNKNIISGLPDSINSFSKPFFENKKYVVYKVKSIVPFTNLSQKIRDYISLKYVTANYASLSSKYLEIVNSKVNSIKEMLSKGDINGIKTIGGVKVYRTGQFSIIKALTEYIPDVKGESIPLPRGVYDVSLMVSWFYENVGNVGISDVGQNTKIIYKVLDRKVLPSKISDIVDKIFSSYQFLYQEVIYSEWNRMLEKEANVKVKDISEFAKEL